MSECSIIKIMIIALHYPIWFYKGLPTITACANKPHIGHCAVGAALLGFVRQCGGIRFMGVTVIRKTTTVVNKLKIVSTIKIFKTIAIHLASSIAITDQTHNITNLQRSHSDTLQGAHT